MRDQLRVRARGLVRAVLARGDVDTIALDVDGTLTDGRMHVNSDGTKGFKSFSVDDHDVIKLAQDAGFTIYLITADKTPITEARAKHMGCFLATSAPRRRAQAMQDISPLHRTVYVADGVHDGEVMKQCAFGIATAGALRSTKKQADAVTSRHGGDRAVAQALLWIMRNLG